MTDAEQLVAAVRARTEGTPYVVAETAKGFDLQIDFEDASWSTRLYEQRLAETWTYHVVLDPGNKSLSITDDVRAVSWGGGLASRGGVPTPMASVSASRSMGRFSGKRVEVTWSPNGHGGYDKTVDVDSTGADGRELVRGPARELGWTEKRGVSERIGLYVGVGTLVLLVLGGIVVGIVALMGGF